VRVARWRWRKETIRDLPSLRALASEDLLATVLRLSFDMEVDLRERDEIERILDDLGGNEARQGRIGILDPDRSGIRIRIDSVTGPFPTNLPAVLQTAVESLHAIASASDPDIARRARIALYKLSTLTQARSPR
jgi:hypothetical protein